jgi:hypothetical protein
MAPPANHQEVYEMTTSLILLLLIMVILGVEVKIRINRRMGWAGSFASRPTPGDRSHTTVLIRRNDPVSKRWPNPVAAPVDHQTTSNIDVNVSCIANNVSTAAKVALDACKVALYAWRTTGEGLRWR